MSIIYTIWDEGNEVEIVGTLEELDEYFEGLCRVMWWCNKIEVAWDYGWDDGPHYWQYIILQMREE